MRPRSAVVRRGPDRDERILRAALDVFIELGFERATVDVISARAGVSKATVYSHFQDKQALFASCLLGQADAFQCALDDAVRRINAPDIERALSELGEAIVRLILSPVVASLHKVIAAEVVRSPELGRALYEHSVIRCRGHLAQFFAERHARGQLDLPDAAVAATQFLALCGSDLKVQVELGLQRCVSDEEIRAAVAQAVRMFLRAYRPRS